VNSRIELRVPSQMVYLGVPDAVLQEMGSDLDCEQKTIDELGTAVIEACTNAMEHGNLLEESKPIEVFFEINETKITVTVSDQGPGFDFSAWQPSEDLMRERGRGIVIMREFTDGLEFGRAADGRFQVRLVKNIVPVD
jgi:serine/threonine-protein kinase RsbW